MQDLFITGVVFLGMFYIIKLISDHLLKRKIIKSGHIEKAQILDPIKAETEENKYPSLKWGLVAFLAGVGLIIIDVIRNYNPDLINYHNASLPIGIELVFISLGFIIYFFIANKRK